MRRSQKPRPEDERTVEEALSSLLDAMAKREYMQPGDVITVLGLPFSRASLDNLARLPAGRLREIGLEALQIAREFRQQEQ